jgi:hypothetical protein
MPGDVSPAVRCDWFMLCEAMELDDATARVTLRHLVADVETDALPVVVTPLCCAARLVGPPRASIAVSVRIYAPDGSLLGETPVATFTIEESGGALISLPRPLNLGLWGEHRVVLLVDGVEMAARQLTVHRKAPRASSASGSVPRTDGGVTLH